MINQNKSEIFCDRCPDSLETYSDDEMYGPGYIQMYAIGERNWFVRGTNPLRDQDVPPKYTHLCNDCLVHVRQVLA
jgi:hypothetical protein